MKIQQKNDFTVRLAVLAQGEREPMTSATDVRVVFQNIDSPRERWEASRLVITDTIEVGVPATALGLGRYAAFVYYTIAASARFAENGAAFTIVRSADEADAEGESISADVNVAFAASGKNGLSAFELAQQAGYAGTFEEWLLAGENANNAAIAAEQAAEQAAIVTEGAQVAAERATAAAEAAEEVARTITARVEFNTVAIADEAQRAIDAEKELENDMLLQAERIDNIEPLVAENAHAIIDLQQSVQAVDAELRDSLQDLTEDVQGNATAITTEVARAQAAEAAAIEKGRQLALRDLYIAAGALYNNTNAPIARTAPWGEQVQHLAGHYYLNGLGDVTEEQMIYIYNERYRMLTLNRSRALQSLEKVRTLFMPVKNNNVASFYHLDIPQILAQAASSLEVVTFNIDASFFSNYLNYVPLVGDKSKNAAYMFGGCMALKYISALNVKPITIFGTGSQGAFYNCKQLKEVSLYQLTASVELSDSPLLTKRSVLYLITNAIPTSAITITLHPDAYARLAEDSEIVAALEAQPFITLVSA